MSKKNGQYDQDPNEYNEQYDHDSERYGAGPQGYGVGAAPYGYGAPYGAAPQGYGAAPQGYGAAPQGYGYDTYAWGYPYEVAQQAAPYTGFPPQVPVGQEGFFPTPPVQGMLPLEESYIENILRLNKGKIATVYMSFDTNGGAGPKAFRGVVEAAGRDHIILSDPETGMRFLLLMVYLIYVTFDEELDYDYPYGVAGLAAYPPR